MVNSILYRIPNDIIGKKDEDLFPAEIAMETAADDRQVIKTGTVEDIRADARVREAYLGDCA